MYIYIANIVASRTRIILYTVPGVMEGGVVVRGEGYVRYYVREPFSRVSRHVYLYIYNIISAINHAGALLRYIKNNILDAPPFTCVVHTHYT